MAQAEKRTDAKASGNGRPAAASANRMRKAGKVMAETVHDAAETAREKAGTVAASAARRVSDGVNTAGREAAERAEEALDALSEAGERLSGRLRRAASSAAGRAQDAVHDIPARVSQKAAEAADAVRSGPVGEIAADLRHVARRNPGLFMLGAAVAGFALARLLTSRNGRDR
ncbi:hypothetical protein HOY34_01810 [Xinfangfangia sp. D13-10-4-6]|uniref:hypothetical protein n=1 Tax=Pseudogemmobacter hezensis TaxID=2737662 RepID=UPI001552BE58|nr:hypothetical protein [Pseudogemmobacter hezensis]NPD13934.1 hypothetical protein [Pseudogemmobacter hezensis]